MRVEEYLLNNEDVTKQVSAYDNVDAVSSSNEGTLACTPFRLVYVRGKNVKDISINEVNSIEFSGPSYPSKYLNQGLAILVIGLLMLVGREALAGILSSPDFATVSLLIGALFLIIGLATLAWGYLLQRATLKVHTPNKTYEFSSKEDDLAEIGHTVRSYEMRNNQKTAT